MIVSGTITVGVTLSEILWHGIRTHLSWCARCVCGSWTRGSSSRCARASPRAAACSAAGPSSSNAGAMSRPHASRGGACAQRRRAQRLGTGTVALRVEHGPVAARRLDRPVGRHLLSEADHELRSSPEGDHRRLAVALSTMRTASSSAKRPVSPKKTMLFHKTNIHMELVGSGLPAGHLLAPPLRQRPHRRLTRDPRNRRLPAAAALRPTAVAAWLAGVGARATATTGASTAAIGGPAHAPARPSSSASTDITLGPDHRSGLPARTVRRGIVRS